MRDFINIMEQHHYFKDEMWNRTDYIYTFETGTRLEFFSADQPSKVRGPRRDVLFINEANNIPYEAYDQLEVRTKKIVWCDWNPVSEFWWYTDVMPHNDVDFITLTYRDNEALDDAIVNSIESRKHNKQWFRVYGEGKLGEVEGRVYTGWQIIDDVPKEARLVRYGLDFGYSTDPTAIVAVYKYNNGLILDEKIYQKKLLNSQIADKLKMLPECPVICDSAEPKSIDELLIYGIQALPATKGQGSVNQGIQSVQNRNISVTKNSTNLIKEYRNYLWDVDKNGKTLNKPVSYLDHGLDAIRYAITDMYPVEDDIIDKDPLGLKNKIPGTYIKPSSEFLKPEEDESFYDEGVAIADQW